jgi:hypothetical protein
MVAIDKTNTIKALELNLSDNEEFYINGDIDEKRYIYMRDQIQMRLSYYLFLFDEE